MQHKTVVAILPFIIWTIITAKTLSTGGQGSSRMFIQPSSAQE